MTHDVHAWRCPYRKWMFGHRLLIEWNEDTLATFPSNASDRDLYKRYYTEPDDVEESCHALKYFNRKSPFAGKLPWRFPFIDFVFYKENRTHVWDHKVLDYALPVERFYPLVWRPFGEKMLLSPFDTLYALHKRYK